MTSRRAVVAALTVALAGFSAAPAARGEGLRDELGRNEVRVYGAPLTVELGASVTAMALPERLERKGYRRVHGRRPESPGEYFWGRELFWIYRRAYRVGERETPAERFGFELDAERGTVTGFRGHDGFPEPRRRQRELEPELLAESLTEARAPRRWVDLSDLPEIAWRAVLAAEDARFFEHGGLDARSLARAALRNLQAGKVVQGGSTITQQLIKVRDLSPQRSLGRKATEAARALALEIEYDKEEILEAYLNSVYFGHLEGAALYGLGAASRAYFDCPAEELSLGEAALLAAMIQGPNRLSPVRHPEAVLARQRWVLSRLESLGWASAAEVKAARKAGLPTLRLRAPKPPGAGHFLRWLAERVEAAAPRRAARHRGFILETSLDPWLQEAAAEEVARGLAQLRRRQPRLARAPLSAALVAVDGRSGDVLAYVGGDPREEGDAFDRVRRARRQPGSTVKPLVLLEAFERCGGRRPLFPARRVADRPLTLDLPSGPWAPENPDGRFHGVLDVRQALVSSANVPFVRVARWCGFDSTAERLRRAGLDLPAEPPPAFVLGAVEVSPLELAEAYTVLASPGRAAAARPLRRLSQPSGRVLERSSPRRRKVVSPAAAYLVRQLLEEAVERGTARTARLDGVEAYGKTGTSSRERDAWFAGGVGSLVVVVWVGLDDGQPLGLAGSEAAAPLWKAFTARAAGTLGTAPPPRPKAVEERWVEDATGLLVREGRRGAHPDLFIRGKEPPKRHLLWPDAPLPVVE